MPRLSDEERDFFSFLLKGRVVGCLQFTGPRWLWWLEDRRGKRLGPKGAETKRSVAEGAMRDAHKALLEAEPDKRRPAL